MPHNVIVLDLETLHSADDCRICGAHLRGMVGACKSGHAHAPIGWDNKSALSLSIGCFFDYTSGSVQWFDRLLLEQTMQALVCRQPLMVSFNGIQFDFALMRAILRKLSADMPPCVAPARLQGLTQLCDQFKALAARSYDILAEIWRADPESKYVKGLNSLGAVCLANGLGGKTGAGAQAPRDWQEGKIAQTLNYCQQDVLLTKLLFELILKNNGTIQRRNGPITLWVPEWRGEYKGEPQ